MSSKPCPKCNMPSLEFQEAEGQTVCTSCGMVLDEDNIVSTIEFQETGDRSHVIGQHMSATSSRPFSSFRNRGYQNKRDSKDQTMAKARQTAQSLMNTMRIRATNKEPAISLYRTALEKKFVFGRKQRVVIAVCLYIICRHCKEPFLLIDFADAAEVNIYVIARTFTEFVDKILYESSDFKTKALEPHVFIDRFSKHKQMGELLGDKRQRIVVVANKLVKCMKRDWMTIGRRPNGICAAALLIASRLHNVNITQSKICKVCTIGAEALHQRLVEFQRTPVSQLTAAEFDDLDADRLETQYSSKVDFKLSCDPPVYTNQKLEELDWEMNSDAESSAILDDTQNITIEHIPSQPGAGTAVKLGPTFAYETAKVQQREKRNREGAFEKRVEMQTMLENLCETLIQEGEIEARQMKKQNADQTTITLKLGAGSEDEDDAVEATETNNDDNGELMVDESEVAGLLCNPMETAARTAVWEREHRQFMIDREEKQKQKEVLAANRTPGTRKRKKIEKDETADLSEPVEPKKSSRINYDKFNQVVGTDDLEDEDDYDEDEEDDEDASAVPHAGSSRVAKVSNTQEQDAAGDDYEEDYDEGYYSDHYDDQEYY